MGTKEPLDSAKRTPLPAKGVGKAQNRASKPMPCAIGGLLELLARPWTMHILWALGANGPTRFGSLRRNVDGISSRVLTERLRDLEGKGFIYRHYEPTIPPAVTYGITTRMKDIQKVFEELHKVSKKWQLEDASGKAAS